MRKAKKIDVAKKAAQAVSMRRRVKRTLPLVVSLCGSKIYHKCKSHDKKDGTETLCGVKWSADLPVFRITWKAPKAKEIVNCEQCLSIDRDVAGKEKV